MHAPLGFADELQQVGDLGDVSHFLLSLSQRFVAQQPGVEEQPVGPLQPLDRLDREALALEADGVHAVALGVPGAGGLHEGQHVLGGHGEAAHEGVVAHPAELVDRGEGADVAAVPNLHVSREGGGVGEDVLAAHVAVVRDVGAGHQEVVVGQGGEPAAAFGAPVQRAAFAEDVAVANLQAGGRPLELEVLGTHAEGGVGVDVIVLAQLRVGADDDVAAEQGAGTDDGVALDDAEGPHHHAFAKAGFGTDDTARVDLCAHFDSPSVTSISMDMNSASATFWPPTNASPRILQMRPLIWSTFTSMTSWSPGCTGLRNFTLSMPMK